MVFEGVIIDQGGHYDESNGEYDCAVDGVYYVSLNVKRYSSQSVALDVLRGSFVFLRIYDTYSANQQGHYSNSAMIRCYPGEKNHSSGLYSWMDPGRCSCAIFNTQCYADAYILKHHQEADILFLCKHVENIKL